MGFVGGDGGKFAQEVRIDLQEGGLFFVCVGAAKAVHFVDPEVDFCGEYPAQRLYQVFVFRDAYRSGAEGYACGKKPSALIGEGFGCGHFGVEGGPEAKLFLDAAVFGEAGEGRL